MSGTSKTPWNPEAGTRSLSDPTPPVTTQAAPLAPGQIVLGRYRLLAKIGEGGMGTVFQAEHVHLGTFVAIKTIHFDRQLGDTRSVTLRFQREMKAVAAVEHPHVVRATDAGEENGLHFLVMEYVPGCDLERLALRLGPMPVKRACELIRQAALGLACIHERGWVHRDIKPSNLLISNSGVVKIADLGLARDWSNEEASGPTLRGQWVGTPDYMAPEQATDSHLLEPRSDLYSLGCSLYRLLTGETVYPAARYPRHNQKLVAHQMTPPPRLAEQPLGRLVGEPEQVKAVQAILERALAKNPEDRYANALEMAQALALLTDPIAGANPPSPTPVVPPNVSLSAATAEEGGPPLLNANAQPPEPEPAEKPATKPRPRIAFRLVPAVVLLLVAVPLGLYLAGAFSPSAPTGSPGLPQPFTGGKLDELRAPVDLNRVPADRWYPLFQHEPVALSWPVFDGVNEWRWKNEQNLVNAGCRSLGILGLGQTDWPSYRFRVSFSQNRWQGGLGLFLGGRFPSRPGQNGSLQYLQFREEVPRPGTRILNVTRSFGALTRRADGQWSLAGTHVASAAPRISAAEITLEVVVTNHVVTEILANGAPLRPLYAEDVQEHFPPGDPPGGWLGVFLSASDGTFRDAQFMRVSDNP